MMVCKDFFATQARQPSGVFGRFFMSLVFDYGNAEMNDFLFDLMAVEPTDHILEIGFGTGKLMKRIAEKLSSGLVTGIDFSDAMVSIAEKRNKHHIKSKRVTIYKGMFEEIPLAKELYDKICTINTVYFWDAPIQTLKKIHDCLKPGAGLYLGFNDDVYLEKMGVSKDVFRYYSQVDIVKLLSDAGFSQGVNIKNREGKEGVSYCAVAIK